MDAIILSVEIKEDRHLVIDLPADIPTGTAEITIQHVERANPETQTEPINPARERARARLQAAGILSTAHVAPKDAVRVSDAELQQFGTLAPGSPTLDDLINEDRGSY